jgi:hypothetical protein
VPYFTVRGLRSDWWRRRESNPRPVRYPYKSLLQGYSRFWFSDNRLSGLAVLCYATLRINGSPGGDMLLFKQRKRNWCWQLLPLRRLKRLSRSLPVTYTCESARRIQCAPMIKIKTTNIFQGSCYLVCNSSNISFIACCISSAKNST